ncbi:MAG: PIN domain-containing protein [Candidatus Nitrosotenuis sp.]
MAIVVLIDTNIIVNAKNANEPYSAFSLQILDAIEDGLMCGIISIISIAELSVRYYSEEDTKGKEELLSHLISNKNFEIVELDLRIAEEAAKIRAQTGLRLPDAILVATGLVKGAQYFITNDKELKRANRYIKVISSKEMLGKIGHSK